jgi:hypothetical protein
MINTDPFPRRTLARRLVVRALLNSHDAGTDTYGALIARPLGLARSAVSDIIDVLAAAGWIEYAATEPGTTWAKVGEPHRCHLTPAGADAARAWLTERT